MRFAARKSLQLTVGLLASAAFMVVAVLTIALLVLITGRRLPALPSPPVRRETGAES